LGFAGASDTEKPEAQKAKPNLCIGFAAKPAHPGGLWGHRRGGAEHGDADTEGAHQPADDVIGGDQPGDWQWVRDDDEGSGDDQEQDDAGNQWVEGGGDRAWVRDEAGLAIQRTSPIRVRPDAGAGMPAGHETDSVERLRDADLPAWYWDPDTGEFAAPTGHDTTSRRGVWGRTDCRASYGGDSVSLPSVSLEALDSS
jgi:hypothetical protein